MPCVEVNVVRPTGTVFRINHYAWLLYMGNFEDFAWTHSGVNCFFYHLVSVHSAAADFVGAQ